jgi:hypothetical protein
MKIKRTKQSDLRNRFFIFSTVLLLGFGALIGIWNIDIAVGAMNSGGCVYQDTKCVPALQFYETALSGVLFAVMFLTLIGLVVIAF